MSDRAWKCVPLTELVDINPESLSNSTPAGSRFRYIDISSVHSGVIDWQTVLECSFATAPSRARRVVKPNDSLFCTVRPSLQAHAYADWKDQDGYVCSTGFAVLRPSRSDSRFIFHKLFSEELARQVRQREVGSSYPAVNEGELGQMFISVPLTIDEQTLIAEILDTLDEAIREAEAVIAKLRLVKAGLLHDLLTRGIDAHGLLRDPIRHPDQFQYSLLGLIPKAWEAAFLAVIITEIEAGSSPSCPNHAAPPGAWGVLKVSAVTHRGFVPSENKVIEDLALIDEGCEVKIGDLLMTRCNTPELVGAACLVNATPPHLMLCDKTLRLSVNPERDDIRFLAHTLGMPSTRRQIEISATGSSGSMKNISQKDIRGYRVVRPGFDEQQEIARRVDAFDNRLEAEQQTLSKLQNLKRGLSHDLLTGRKRVKN
jgi:type I restriction enzyme S subunit